MYDDLTTAITAALIASPLGAAMGNRIFPSSQVPPDADWPRCYISYRRGPPYTRYPVADGGVDRHATVEILFATTTQKTAQADHMIGLWDKQAWPIIEGVRMTGLAFILRVGDVPALPQSDDRNTYIVGGGQYDALVQVN